MSIQAKLQELRGDLRKALCRDVHDSGVLRRGKVRKPRKILHSPCPLNEELVHEFNALGIANIEEVKFLNTFTGSYINMTYSLLNGSNVKFCQDEWCISATR